MISDPFLRHGITHLSPSSLKTFREQPAAWVMRYLFRTESDMGPSAWRGSAVEAGLDMLLFGQSIETAQAAMNAKWNELAQGLVELAAVEEQDDLGDYLEQARKALHGRPVPLTRQRRINVTIPGIEVPIIGFCDYCWADSGLDLKTTRRMPSVAVPAHVEQMAVYTKATGLPFSLLYITPKKWAVYEVTPAMVAEAWRGVVRGANAIRHMLGLAASPADALKLYSPDYSNWNWSKPMIEAAEKVYSQ